jgi:hypothetical protein
MNDNLIIFIISHSRGRHLERNESNCVIKSNKDIVIRITNQIFMKSYISLCGEKYMYTFVTKWLFF